jgi:hypothetical protein
MSKLRVNAFGISIHGYGAGPDQSLASPMGVSGMALHQWVHGTKHLFASLDMASLGYRCTERAATEHATHVVLTK